MKNDFESKQVILDKKDGEFLEEIKSELGLSSPQRVLKVTEKVLRSIQKNLGTEEIKRLLVNFPQNLQTLFKGNSSQQESPIYFDHLDQWVETIYREDEVSQDRAFYSEIEILNVIILMVRKLDKLYNLLSFPGFKFSLIREIKQASI